MYLEGFRCAACDPLPELVAMKAMQCDSCGERQMRGGTSRACHMTPGCIGKLVVVPKCACCSRPAETIIIGTELIEPVCVDCAMAGGSS